jgi:hypothetical protein
MAFGFSNKQLLVIVLLATLAAIFVVPIASKYIPGATRA